MKVFVVAIDGLEYELVTRWRLRVFMQSYYGKHDVKDAVKPGDPLYTPLIWAAFLLGKPAYMYNFDRRYIDEMHTTYAYGPILKMLYKIRKRLLGNRNLGIRNILLKIGLFNIEKVKRHIIEYETMPQNALRNTLVYELEQKGYRVWRTSFPGLPYDKYAIIRAELSRVLTSRDIVMRKKIVDFLFKHAVQDLNKAVNALHRFDFVLYYTPLIDDAHHLFYRPNNLKLMTLLRSYYGRLAREVSTAIRKASVYDSVLILIVSDHGYDPNIHDHSPYGFWSSNIRLPYKPRSILDFRWIIEDMIRV